MLALICLAQALCSSLSFVTIDTNAEEECVTSAEGMVSMEVHDAQSPDGFQEFGLPDLQIPEYMYSAALVPSAPSMLHQHAALALVTCTCTSSLVLQC